MKFFTSTSDPSQFELQNGLFLVATVVFSTALVMVWALKFKKKRRYKYKQRHRRNKDRPMNPTLAETGGLPPLRNRQNVAGQPVAEQPKS